jgi:hypothetical protein
MRFLFILLDLSSVWEVTPKVTSPWSLSAFALLVVLFLVLYKRKEQIPRVVWIVIVLLVVIPIAASLYSSFITKSSIYRLRVTVIDPQNMPIEDAKVWSTFGGEPKKVAAGWEFDIPEESKPRQGKLSIFAAKEAAFLYGQADLTLDSEHNPAITLQLKRDDSAKVRGQVVDAKNRAGVPPAVLSVMAAPIPTPLPHVSRAGKLLLLIDEEILLQAILQRTADYGLQAMTERDYGEPVGAIRVALSRVQAGDAALAASIPFAIVITGSVDLLPMGDVQGAYLVEATASFTATILPSGETLLQRVTQRGGGQNRENATRSALREVAANIPEIFYRQLAGRAR